MRLRLVTGNAHKLQEFDRILRGLGCDLSLDELDTGSVVEYGVTYYQNAYRKARSGLSSLLPTESDCSIVLADDSGLELPLFDNMPGTHSARFQYEGLVERTALSAFLSEHDVSLTPARFVCWIVAFVPGSRRCLACSGAVTGAVTPEPRGSQGFGYDPLFTPDGYSITFGEMDPAVKDHISHRSRAAEVLWCSLQGLLSLRP